MPEQNISNDLLTTKTESETLQEPTKTAESAETITTTESVETNTTAESAAKPNDTDAVQPNSTLDAETVEQNYKAAEARIQKELEELTQSIGIGFSPRSMKHCVAQHLLEAAQEDPDFCLLLLNEDKTLDQCFAYINKEAKNWYENLMKKNNLKCMGLHSTDVPDDMCYDWSREYYWKKEPKKPDVPASTEKTAKTTTKKKTKASAKTTKTKAAEKQPDTPIETAEKQPDAKKTAKSRKSKTEDEPLMDSLF